MVVKYGQTNVIHICLKMFSNNVKILLKVADQIRGKGAYIL